VEEKMHVRTVLLKTLVLALTGCAAIKEDGMRVGIHEIKGNTGGQWDPGIASTSGQIVSAAGGSFAEGVTAGVLTGMLGYTAKPAEKTVQVTYLFIDKETGKFSAVGNSMHLRPSPGLARLRKRDVAVLVKDEQGDWTLIPEADYFRRASLGDRPTAAN
jgi:hypothetical protein